MPTVVSDTASNFIQVIYQVSDQTNIELIALPGAMDTAQF